MSKAIQFIKERKRLLLKYQPSNIRDPYFVGYRLETTGRVKLRKTFSFERADLVDKVESKVDDQFEYTFLFGIAEGEYFRVKKKILGLKNDLLLTKEMQLTDKTFIAIRDISIFPRIDELIEEPIIVGGNLENAISLDAYDELLANFPTTTEVTHYSRARIIGVLKDFLGTMSDAQSKLDKFLNKKKTIQNRSKIEFIKEYEPEKFEYVRDEISAMLLEVETYPKAYKEADWQRQITEFILILFPKYIAVLEKVHIKDFYPKGYKHQTNREVDLVLVDANGSIDIIEIKRPEAHQLLSKKAGTRGNFTPSSALSEAIMQVEKYLFHMSKWGRLGEEDIQKRWKNELPHGFGIRITNPKAMLILGRDNNFTVDQMFDFEIIKRKYANIVEIMTYDDLLRRLDNIITMIHHNYSKLGSKEGLV